MCVCVCEFCISLSCIVYDVYNTWFYLIIDTRTCMHVYIYAYLISWLSCILVFGFRPTSLSDLIGSYLARNCRCIDDRKCQYGEYRFDGKNMEKKHRDETSVLSISVLDYCQYTWKARCLKKTDLVHGSILIKLWRNLELASWRDDVNALATLAIDGDAGTVWWTAKHTGWNRSVAQPRQCGTVAGPVESLNIWCTKRRISDDNLFVYSHARCSPCLSLDYQRLRPH